MRWYVLSTYTFCNNNWRDRWTFQEGDRKLFTSPVKALINEGIVVACVGYDFATTISLNEVVEEATKALHVREIFYLSNVANYAY